MKPKRSPKTGLLTWSTFVRVSEDLKKKMEREMARREIESYSDFVRVAIKEACK